MINFILALIMGGIMGWLASIVMRRDATMGVFWNIVVGCLGSMIGGSLFAFLTGGTPNLRDAPFNPMTLLVAFLGAIVLLAIVNLVQRGRAR